MTRAFSPVPRTTPGFGLGAVAVFSRLFLARVHPATDSAFEASMNLIKTGK